MKKLIKQIDIPFFIVGIFYFIITFFTDKRIINFHSFSLSAYIIVKICVFAILFAITQFLAKVFRKKDKTAKSYFKHFLIYFIPMLIILILIWPGVWHGSDVKNLIKYAKNVKFTTRWIYLTSLFYSVGLSLFPTFSGAIVLQMLFMSIVVGYLSKRTFDYFKNSKWCYLIYVPFFLPVTVFYTFYCNRPIMCGITYLLLISICLFDYLNNKKLSKKKFFLLAILAAIISNWRSESIYLLIVGPLFVFLLYHVKVNTKNICFIILGFAACFLAVKAPQVYLQRNEGELSKATRNLPIYINALSYMTRKDLKGDNLKENLEKVDKVLNIENLKKYWSIDDTPCSWRTEDNCVRKSYTLEEYKEFKEAANQIILDNLPIYLEAKTLTFKRATRIYKDYFTAINLYQDDNGMIKNDVTTKPIISNKVRVNVLRLIEGREYSKYNPSRIYRYTNNLMVPLVLLMILLVLSIVKKKLLLFLSSGMFLGHTFLIFFTAPASYFMYYYSVFLAGLFLGLFVILIGIARRKNKNIKKKAI